MAAAWRNTARKREEGEGRKEPELSSGVAGEGLIEQGTSETKLKALRASRGKARGKRKLESEGRKACLVIQPWQRCPVRGDSGRHQADSNRSDDAGVLEES